LNIIVCFHHISHSAISELADPSFCLHACAHQLDAAHNDSG
jgi:hypothetical protein